MPTGELAADDTCVYSKELYDAESMAADRLAQMIRENRPLFTSRNELEQAIARAEKVHQVVLDSDQRQASQSVQAGLFAFTLASRTR